MWHVFLFVVFLTVPVFLVTVSHQRVNGMPMRLTNPAAVMTEHGGLGFSEFVELVARIAVDGMLAESYHVLFPTPFSKVLAILTVWGVADLKKIEEVRIIRSENVNG
jgi:hypothetical protein